MTVTHSVTDLPTATGTMRCKVVRPTLEGAFPTVIFYSEIFQITEPIARTAAFLAGHGYVVIVPEVFHELNTIGTVLAYDDSGKEKGNADKFTKPLTDHDSDTQAIVRWVDQQSFCNGSLGSFGVCLGGHLACRAALHPRVQAASCLYATDIHSSTMPAGDKPQTIDQLSDIAGEIMFVWGRQDPHVPLVGRVHLYSQLNQSDTHYTWHELNGQHAFIRDEGERYDPELASLCQRLTLDLFHRTLR
ncbi:dienelactone hydrolase family protein [Rubritalea tangerina]|uniref:Dienelactone hydrolase family protein n=1 Tax=Rubritalea tangerina TaxID=430798 RepID=A0ABW4Z654_9BACT